MSYLSFMKEQIASIRRRDPSIKSTLEILFFPSFRALNTWYITHRLYERGHYALARILSLKAQQKTGIDIHPGAQIGRNLFIDHGSGVVIGETCVIGNDVTIYQGVTLGGTGKISGKRHPTVQDGVVLGAGSKIIGAVTIGKYAKIGAGSVIVRDVTPYTTMVPVPAHPIRYRDERIPVLTVAGLDRKVDREVSQLKMDEQVLRRRIDTIEKQEGLLH